MAGIFGGGGGGGPQRKTYPGITDPKKYEMPNTGGMKFATKFDQDRYNERVKLVKQYNADVDAYYADLKRDADNSDGPRYGGGRPRQFVYGRMSEERLDKELRGKVPQQQVLGTATAPGDMHLREKRKRAGRRKKGGRKSTILSGDSLGD